MSDERIDLPLSAQCGTLILEQDGSLVKRSVLPGGVRVLSEEVPSFHSVSIGMWVGVGSRDEHEGTFGSTHFLEHLLFKGTKNRSSQEIAARSDYLGGSFNAATSKQATNYYGHVFEEDLPAAIELLADMVTSATLTREDMDMERGVILEELAMYHDDASDVAGEELPRLVFTDDHPLSRPVGGTPESVKALEHDNLVEHYRRHYVPNELVVCAAGAVNHEELCERVYEALTAKGWELGEGVDAHEPRLVDDITYGESQERYVERPVEQSAVVVGMPGLRVDDERRTVLYALSAILGGGQSSRLFQTVREERGLAYSTYSFPASYREGGLFALYGACAPGNASEVAQLLGECLDTMAENGVSAEEVESAYRRVRADIVFGAERLSSRMNRLATSELVRTYHITRAALLDQARTVTGEQIQDLARDLAAAPRSTVCVGAFGEQK
ncbi:MAG: insulinase family protein [Actinomycetaceae bacterium]|nr:insulinase family protein [Actinomycetaceae bacterium]